MRGRLNGVAELLVFNFVQSVSQSVSQELAPLIVFSKSLRGLPLLLHFLNHCGACPSYSKQFNLGLAPRNLFSNS